MGCLGSLLGLILGIIGGIFGLVFGVVGSVVGGVSLIVGIVIPIVVLAMPVLVAIAIIWVLVQLLRGNPDSDTHSRATYRPTGKGKGRRMDDEPQTSESNITDIDEWEDIDDELEEDHIPPHRTDDLNGEDKRP